jgi:hypothetical protein
MDIYVKRERKTALSYSTRPKRSLLDQPFRLRRFRVTLSFASMSQSVAKDADRQPLRVILTFIDVDGYWFYADRFCCLRQSHRLNGAAGD